MSEKITPNLSFLTKRWPSEIVARSEIDKFTGGLVNPRTIANYDCAGIGPMGRIRIGRKIGYPTEAVVKWMEARAELLD